MEQNLDNLLQLPDSAVRKGELSHEPIHGRRPAFTLIEMLVVILIMTVIITLAAIEACSNLNRNKGVPNAANQLEGWVSLSRVSSCDESAAWHSPDRRPEQPEPIAGNFAAIHRAAGPDCTARTVHAGLH